jgi:hypothetical protein
MAAAGRISSEFNRLRDASWLSTGYTLGLCAAQPMVGDREIENRDFTNPRIVWQVERYLRSQTASVAQLFAIRVWMYHEVGQSILKSRKSKY